MGTNFLAMYFSAYVLAIQGYVIYKKMGVVTKDHTIQISNIKNYAKGLWKCEISAVIWLTMP